MADTRELQEQKRLVDAVNASIRGVNEALKQQIRIHDLIRQKAEGAALDLAATDAEISALLGSAGSDLEAGASRFSSGMSSFESSTAAAGSGVAGLGEVLEGFAKNVERTFDGAGKAISGYVDRDVRQAVGDIQRQFGGLGDDINQGANNQSAAMRELVSDTYEMYVNTTNDAYMVQDQGLQFAFDNLGDLMGYFTELSGDPINALAMTRDASKEMVIEMGMFGKGLGLTQAEVGTFVQRQISLTGKAGTDMLQEAAAAAKGIELRTGISSKLISKNVHGIMEDTKNFGNVTVQEAARISTALLQIGIDYSDLGNMLGKFQGFDQAAGTVSNLTSVFGLQMDAMAMMESANTDQDKFLRDMRESFLAAGKSVDTLTLYEKRFIQEQLALKDVESVERLLDPRAAISGMEDLAAASEEMDPEEALKSVKDDIDMIRDASELTAEALATMARRGIMAPFQDAALSIEQDAVKMAGSLTQLGTGKGAEAVKELGQSAEGITAGFETAFETVETKFTELIESMKRKLEESGLLGESESKTSARFRAAWDLSLERVDDATGQTFNNMTEIATKELKKQLKTSGSVYNEMAKQVGRLGSSYSDLTEEERKSLADRMKLGEDWEKELEMIFNSQAAATERQVMSDQDTARALLEQVKAEGGELGADTLASVTAMLPAKPEEIRDFVAGGTTTWEKLASSAEASRQSAQAQAEAAARAEADGDEGGAGGRPTTEGGYLKEIHMTVRQILSILPLLQPQEESGGIIESALSAAAATAEEGTVVVAGILERIADLTGINFGGEEASPEDGETGEVASVLALNADRAQEESGALVGQLELIRETNDLIAASALEQSVETVNHLMAIKELLTAANTAAQTSEIPVQLTIQLGREKLEQVLGIEPGETIVTFGNVE